MSGFFGRLPIRLKLIVLILTVTATVLVLAAVGYLITDYAQTRGALREELLSQAHLIVSNTAASLEFGDRNAALETLQTLRLRPGIRLACLYDARGELFVEYRPPGEASPCPAAPVQDGTLFTGNHLEASRIGLLRGKPFGSVLLRSNLEALAQRARIQVGIVAVLLVITIAIAMLLSSRLQAVVADPVTALARTASEVSGRGDYSLRATKTTEDELGLLVDAFNRMLERIQQREGELSRANEELRREVAERRRAEQERAELLVREREANRVKDEFLATLSHELRTPLNAILGWTKLLRANAVPVASVDRALEKVERNAQVQARLIEDLLEISRIVSGKLRLEFRPFDLVSLCATAIDSIRPTAEARGVVINRDFGAASMATLGDPDRLQQVVWNLLSNAVKFTPPGGTVSVRLTREGDTDEIVVSDTGIGIDPAFLPSVFETFRQADASSTRAHGGLGLGLSIVKQLVGMHGGEVRAFSDGPGQGSTFRVRLPVRVEARRADLQPLVRPHPVRGRLAGRTILVVDDDADTRELLVSALESAGGRVSSAASARDALTVCTSDPPDAIVSDIAMPGEDGYMLLQRLRDELGERLPRVRIALSAFAGPHDRDRALAAGFDRHVSKPVDPIALVRLVDELLSNGAGAAS